MPPKAQQSRAPLYTAIFFSAMFIIASVIAVVFYVKSEDLKKANADLQSEMDKFARNSEVKSAGAVDRGKTVLGTVLSYLNNMVRLTNGEPSEEDTADMRYDKTMQALNSVFAQLNNGGIDTNSVPIVRLLDIMDKQRANALAIADDKEEQIQKLIGDADTLQNEHFESEKQWQAQLAEQKKVADDVIAKHNQLQQLIDDKFGEQVASLNTRLTETKNILQDKENDLLKARAELQKTEKRLEYYLGIIESIKPQPMKEIKAYKPDGEIVSVDLATGIVILNLGSMDHVYPGLTFAIYNKNAPIPPDGKGKAEVEVFKVEDRISMARIKPDTIDPKQSIIAQDPIANLIWDARDKYTFVVAGNFDLDGDGSIDTDGADKIRQLIESWNAEVVDDITIETDFVVLGKMPIVGARPGAEEMDVDPSALEKYENTVKQQQRYNSILEQVKAFSIPVFDLSRFLYFIGQGGGMGN